MSFRQWNRFRAKFKELFRRITFPQLLSLIYRIIYQSGVELQVNSFFPTNTNLLWPSGNSHFESIISLSVFLRNKEIGYLGTLLKKSNSVMYNVVWHTICPMSENYDEVLKLSNKMILMKFKKVILNLYQKNCTTYLNNLLHYR